MIGKKSLRIMFVCCISLLITTQAFSQGTGEYLHYRLGMRYKTEKQYDKAIDEFRKVLAEYPDNYNVYLHIAEIRFLQNQPALAIPNLKQALTYNPGWSKAHRLLADAYSKDGQIQKSIAEYQQYQQTCDPAERDSVQRVIDRLIPKIGKKTEPADDFSGERPVTGKKVNNPNKGQKKNSDSNSIVVNPPAGSVVPGIKPDTSKPASAKQGPVDATALAGKQGATTVTPESNTSDAKTIPEKQSPAPVATVKTAGTETNPTEKPGAIALAGQKSGDLFNRALESFRAQQYDQALSQLKEVLVMQPGFPGAYYYAGLIRYERGERTLAKINLLRSRGYQEPEYSGLLCLGAIYGEEKKYTEAIRLLSQFVKKTGSASKKKEGKELLEKYRSLLGSDAIVRKGDVETPAAAESSDDEMPAGPLMLEVRIDTLLSMVTTDTLNEPGIKMISGIREFRSGNFDNAIREFKKTLAAYPTGTVAAQCLFNVGVCYFKLRMLNEAENQFQQILDRFPGHTLAGQSSFLKALAYSEQKESIIAERLFRGFLQSYRGHKLEGKAWEKLGDAYMDLDQPKKAIDAFAQAAGKTVNFEDKVCAWYKTGNAYAAIGNMGRAFASFDSAIFFGERHRVFIRVPDSYYRIADEKYKSKDYEGARKYYEAVIQKYPDFQETPWAFFQIGNIHKNLQQFKDAIKSYNVLISRFPEDYWAKQARWKLDDAVWEHEYQTTLH